MVEIYKKSNSEFNNFTADFLLNKLTELQNKKEKNNIALSGGNTPLPILDILKNHSVQWNKFNFFIVDERCVNLNDPSSNFGNIKKVFFDHIPSNNYSILQDNLSIKESLDQYIEIINNKLRLDETGIPIFDLIILGMGEDGHIASLFPETKALDEKKKIVVENFVPKLKSSRLTMTFPILENALEIIVFIKGRAKEQIFNQLYSEKSKNYPILKLVKAKVKIIWIIGE